MRLPPKTGGTSLHGKHELVVGSAFLVAIACVAGAATYTEQNLSAIVSRSHAVLDKAGVRAVALLDIRSDLRKVTRSIEDVEQAPEADCQKMAAAALRQMEAAQHRIDESVGVDPQLLSPFRAALSALRSQARGACGRLVCGQSQDQPFALFRTSLEGADTALADLEGLQREQAADGAFQVDSAHARFAQRMYAIDGASVFVAGSLGLFVVGAMRRRRRAMESRLGELEMFAVRVAHDLRSPLAPALLALQRVAARTPKDDRLRGLVERGERSLHTIEHIIADLFAFVSSGDAPEPGASSSLRDTLEDVLAENADAATQRNIHLSLQCEGQARVACSSGVLASIVGNLVSNAIQYIGDGDQKRVDIRALVRGDGVRIEVSDSGPGVAVDAVARIFEPYVRGDKRGAGLGLGLATVRRLVVAHGGRVGVVPGETRGSTFWVELPAAQAPLG
jgi:signal transduction histidine kinase